ncbi:MAG: hypothetical protein FWC09_11180, partial [Lachnospiraceae bacterium]|nr:hypothetical protein [Lachnospiraceae bacterium]
DKGSGILLQPSSAVGVSSRSKHKDGAFEFIDYLMSDAYQNRSENNSLFSIPLKRSAYDSMIEQMITPPDGFQRGTISWGFDDLMVEMDQSRNIDNVAAFNDLVNRADTLKISDQMISTIIFEEAQSFFNGQKSAKAAAEIIQNRVQVYVNENR